MEKRALLNEMLHSIEKTIPRAASERFRLKLSIDEALQNAFSHGNGNDPEKEISVTCFQEHCFWGVIIRDEGDGFHPDGIKDATSKEGLMRENGRGLLIMHEYMDRIGYFEGGRTVRLIKEKRPQVSAASDNPLASESPSNTSL